MFNLIAGRIDRTRARATLKPHRPSAIASGVLWIRGGKARILPRQPRLPFCALLSPEEPSPPGSQRERGRTVRRGPGEQHPATAPGAIRGHKGSVLADPGAGSLPVIEGRLDGSTTSTFACVGLTSWGPARLRGDGGGALRGCDARAAPTHHGEVIDLRLEQVLPVEGLEKRQGVLGWQLLV